MDFKQQTESWLDAEIYRFRMQLLEQQEKGHPITPAQKRREWALWLAYKQAVANN